VPDRYRLTRRTRGRPPRLRRARRPRGAGAVVAPERDDRQVRAVRRTAGRLLPARPHLRRRREREGQGHAGLRRGRRPFPGARSGGALDPGRGLRVRGSRLCRHDDDDVDARPARRRDPCEDPRRRRPVRHQGRGSRGRAQRVTGAARGVPAAAL
ncbi:MAG: hypothetical protein AVDCRST_MAG47-1448, partial [uncultured Nocardioidaceae bacterium]